MMSQLIPVPPSREVEFYGGVLKLAAPWTRYNRTLAASRLRLLARVGDASLDLKLEKLGRWVYPDSYFEDPEWEVTGQARLCLFSHGQHSIAALQFERAIQLAEDEGAIYALLLTGE